MFSFFKKKPKADQAPAGDPAPIVVPRIKHRNFLAAVNDIPGITDASRPLVEPLVGDLLLTYAIDIGPSYLSVTPDNLKDHGLAEADVRRLAEAFGREAMRDVQVRSDGTLHELTAPEGMAACSILYPELWRQIEGELAGPVVVAFPHRDFALYALADEKGLASLKDVLGQINFDETHALSALLYRPTAEGWQVVAA